MSSKLCWDAQKGETCEGKTWKNYLRTLFYSGFATIIFNQLTDFHVVVFLYEGNLNLWKKIHVIIKNKIYLHGFCIFCYNLLNFFETLVCFSGIIKRQRNMQCKKQWRLKNCKPGFQNRGTTGLARIILLYDIKTFIITFHN